MNTTQVAHTTDPCQSKGVTLDQAVDLLEDLRGDFSTLRGVITSNANTPDPHLTEASLMIANLLDDRFTDLIDVFFAVRSAQL